MLSQACRGVKLVTSAKVTRGQAGSRGSGSAGHPAALRPRRLLGFSRDGEGKATRRGALLRRRLFPSPDPWLSWSCAKNAKMTSSPLLGCQRTWGASKGRTFHRAASRGGKNGLPRRT